MSVDEAFAQAGAALPDDWCFMGLVYVYVPKRHRWRWQAFASNRVHQVMGHPESATEHREAMAPRPRKPSDLVGKFG